jgi:hypothetical protein
MNKYYINSVQKNALFMVTKLMEIYYTLMKKYQFKKGSCILKKDTIYKFCNFDGSNSLESSFD